MSLRKVAIIDKQIITHLAHGGELRDPMGISLVHGLLRESLENKKIAHAVKFHDISKDLLCEIYISGYENILGSPLIEHGGMPILVPSLLFLDDINFPSILDSFYMNCNESNKNEMILYNSSYFLTGLQEKAALMGRSLAWPPENWPTLMQLKRRGTGCGCLPIVTVGGFCSFLSLEWVLNLI